MSLANRVTAFFVALLAIVLAGFSVGIYSLAHSYLHRQVDERLDSALATLVAAAEISPAGIEWEPQERELDRGRESATDHLWWIVRGEHGEILDHSNNWSARSDSQDLRVGRRFTDHNSHAWRTRDRRLTPSMNNGPRPTADSANSQPSPKDVEPAILHPELDFLAFAPLGPTEAALQRLGMSLCGLSIGLWLVAAVVGRRVCRRALSPLNRMAETSRGIDADDLGRRLPVPATGDELAALASAFNDLLQRLHESFERHRRFSGDASHQLRTPLAAMIGQLDVALRRDREPTEYRRVLSVVRAKADHLRQITESLLFLSRTNNEASFPDMEVIELADWVPRQLTRWSGHNRASDLDFRELRYREVAIQAHPGLLAQALDNLLDNAIKYSIPGSPIHVRLEANDDWVSLMIEDRGEGISPDDLPHVFEPFYRSASARLSGRPGVGLGLAVARRVIEAFGGRLIAQSELGRGATLTVRIPRWKPLPTDGADSHAEGVVDEPSVMAVYARPK
jgi:two-component system, OmpR family, sensor kinase